MRIATLLPLCLLLTACQTTGPLDEHSSTQFPPAGSRLVLKQALTIPAHSAGVFLQGGLAISDKDLNRYQPHCRLEVQDVRETAQTVAADEFLVRRAHQETISVAQAGLMKTAWLYTRYGPTYSVYRTVLDLRSERQPRVRWLTCEQWGDPALGQHLSIHEIRQTLGEIFMLSLPAAATGDRQ